VLAEFFATGRYRVRSKAEVAATSSPSMDIAKASNFERFIHDVSDDASEVASLWSAVERTGGFDIATTPMWQRILDRNIVAGSSTHSERLDTIREIDERHGRIVDPHTADGLNVGRRLAQEGAPLVCLETALPTKFEATIQEALGRKPHRPLGFEGLEDRPQHVEVMAPDSAALRTRIERFTATWRG
jgi:threonine synthase